MCELCAAPDLATDGFAILRRPAESLDGLIWEGEPGPAAGEAVRRLLAGVQAFAGRGTWDDAVVGLSWRLGAGRIRFFAGLPPLDGRRGEGWRRLELPPLAYACVWHSASEGPVAERYGMLAQWVRDCGHAPETEVLGQREEYPPGADMADPQVLRLMLPLARSD